MTDKKDRALPLSSKFRDRNPPMFEQKVEQMYKDDESSDEGRDQFELFSFSFKKVRGLFLQSENCSTRREVLYL